jgi:hypothetical protein
MENSVDHDNLAMDTRSSGTMCGKVSSVTASMLMLLSTSMYQRHDIAANRSNFQSRVWSQYSQHFLHVIVSAVTPKFTHDFLSRIPSFYSYCNFDIPHRPSPSTHFFRQDERGRGQRCYREGDHTSMADMANSQRDASGPSMLPNDLIFDSL